MTHLLAISGSLRRNSYNTALARAAQQHAPAGVTVDIATLHGIPLYDGDLETSEGSPAAVRALKAHILYCDGLMLFTPEYNHGIPGVFKNALDWLSRGDSATVFRHRPAMLCGATPGGFGTALAQAAWLPTLKALGVRLHNGGMMLSRANQAIDASGQLTDPAALRLLADQVAAFAAFVKA